MLEQYAPWPEDGVGASSALLTPDLWQLDLIPTPPRSPTSDTDDLLSDVGSTNVGTAGCGAATKISSTPQSNTRMGCDRQSRPQTNSGQADLIYPPSDFSLAELPDYVSMSPLELPLLEVEDLDLSLEELDLDLQLPEDLLSSCDSGGGPGPGGGLLPCSHHGLDSCTSCTQLAQAGTELRHDCMWVGMCTAEAHNNTHHYHPHPHSHPVPRTHHDSGSSTIADLLLESQSSAALDGFNQLTGDEFSHDDDDDSSLEDVAVVPGALHHRPDTPSESSETDTDDGEDDGSQMGVSHEEEVYTSDCGGRVEHVDHSYFCPRVPSPASRRRHPAPALHTPSDTEDEIDVVSVGSPDSAYSSGSNRSSKRCKSPNSESNSVTGTTYIRWSGLKKVVKVCTNKNDDNNAAPTLGRGTKKLLVRKEGHHSSSSVKRKNTGDDTKGMVILRGSSSHRNNKRLKHHDSRGNSSNKKKRTQRNEPGDDPEKRHLHNSLERMRRVDLRNAFEDLRILVPELNDKDKAPKVEILKKAGLFCRSVGAQERNLEQEKEKMRRRNVELRKKLQALQRQLR